MPSRSLNQWKLSSKSELDEISDAHTIVGGSKPGRRFATQQINRAFAVLLASHFQRFCRDIHSECVDHILTVVAPPVSLRNLFRAEFTRDRKLDRGNAQPASLGADFGRLGITLWDQLERFDSAARDWNDDLVELNEWRNAIAHQDFSSPRLGGISSLHLERVRRWRKTCEKLAVTMDEVLRRFLQSLTGASPW